MYLKRNDELVVLSLYLGDFHKQFYLREISRLLKIPLKNVQRIVNSLEKRKILKSNVHGKNKYFALNLSNIQSKLYLLQSETDKTVFFLEAYPQLKIFLKEISTSTIIIFGSFAKFIVEKDSDLDLLIISEKEEKLPSHVLPYKIHEVRLSEKAFRKALEKQETLIKEIEENHVTLNNHSLYINMMWSHYAK